MPTYEYECKRCGFLFEEFQSINAQPLKHCPKCNGSVKRLIGKGSGIVFKGSGFYATDYRSPTYSGDAKKDSGSKSSGESCPNKDSCKAKCDKKKK